MTPAPWASNEDGEVFAFVDGKTVRIATVHDQDSLAAIEATPQAIRALLSWRAYHRASGATDRKVKYEMALLDTDIALRRAGYGDQE